MLAAAVVSFPLMYGSAKAAFQGVDRRLEDAARTLGAGEARVFLRVTLPLAWPGIVTGLVLAFAHTLGEFGVVLMVGGSIPGETRTVAIAIYDRVQAFDGASAAVMSALLLLISLAALGVSYALSGRIGRRV